MIEFCEHSGSEFGARKEYCGIEAADPNGAVGVVMEMMDLVLYENLDTTGDTCRFIVDDEGQELIRSFSYLQGDVLWLSWPLTEKQLEMSHVKDRQSGAESYHVATFWWIRRPGSAAECFMTNYIVEKDECGKVAASIDEWGFAADCRTFRPMTPYDYEQLFTELDALYDLHAVERRDNALALEHERRLDAVELAG